MEQTLLLVAKMIGAGLASIGAFGGGIGIGLVFLGSQEAIARNPDLKGILITNMYLGMGMCELTSLFCVGIAVMILFVVK